MQGKLIKCKTAERALPQCSGTPDLDLLKRVRKRRPGERLAAKVDIRKNGWNEKEASAEKRKWKIKTLLEQMRSVGIRSQFFLCNCCVIIISNTSNLRLICFLFFMVIWSNNCLLMTLQGPLHIKILLKLLTTENFTHYLCNLLWAEIIMFILSVSQQCFSFS